VTRSCRARTMADVMEKERVSALKDPQAQTA
jgi:hypothetical protein